MSDINVVPYIDVMLVLLVIFMVTAPLLYHGIDVDLPETRAEPVEPSDIDTVVVSVDADGGLSISIGLDAPRRIDRAALAAEVTDILAATPTTPVVVRGDRTVPYGDVVALMAALQDAGVAQVGLLTRPAEE